MLNPMMKQTQPNRWSCLLTSFAIALATKQKFIFDWLGHDGSEIIWPEEEDPYNRRSFHIQELIDYTWWRGFSVTGFEPYPRSSNRKGEPYRIEFPIGNQERLLRVMKTHRGVITGRTVESQAYHAVAWNNETGKIWNPNGEVEDLSSIAINTFWAIANVM